MNSVTFTYQRTKDDILKLQVWQAFFKGLAFRLLTILFPIMGLYFMITSLMSGVVEPMIMVGSFYLIFYPVLHYFMVRARVNRLFKDPELKFDTTTFTYSDSGINVQSEQGEILVEWERVTQVYNVKRYIYVYIDRRTAILVNKETLTETEVNSILDICKKNALPKVCKY